MDSHDIPAFFSALIFSGMICALKSEDVENMMKAIVTRVFGLPPEMGIEEREKPAVKPGHSVVKMRAAPSTNFQISFARRASAAQKRP